MNQKPAAKSEELEDSKKPPAQPAQPVQCASKVQDLEKLEKSVIKLLKSHGKYYRKILPKRVKPSGQIKYPPSTAWRTPKSKYILEISALHDWDPEYTSSSTD